jgi:ABC-2 type transport system ATP-binding protein
LSTPDREGVVVEAVSKSFAGHDGTEVRALRDVSFQARRGSITGLVGPDGAGKTTLLRIAAGLRARRRGVRVLGIDPVAEPDRLRERIGYAAEFGLYEDLGVRETSGSTPIFKASRATGGPSGSSGCS